MTRWTTLLMDDAQLSELPNVPAADVLRHADLVAARAPKPIELYQRWERQQWSAEDLSFGRDQVMLNDERVPAGIRAMLSNAIATFIIGEYTGLDMLGPILTGSPDEEYSVFLGTQIADETRHTRAVFRMGAEVLGMDENPRTMLAQAWGLATPAHTELALLEGRIVREVHERPMDYGQWLQAVSLFHLITEGVLALVGQRVLVHALRDINLFDGIKTAFVAMCRDESRHIGFGLHALRTGVKEGYAEQIYGVLEEAVPLALRLDNEFEGIAVDFRAMSIDILRRHLGAIGADPAFISHLLDRHDTRSKLHTA
ncbi:ribonucleotide-diphosphate reductase subunit beta [Amycolatopsis sp. NPDC102389]|uniref:ribonucleotide-diphosphate reductase subunit beta n=1 Tax=Amycolatopsis sp. NPDC102389 TaxID=3363941 RepID=UPI00380CD949